MAALTYLEDLTTRFTSGFTEDVVCLFADGFYTNSADQGVKFINMKSMKIVPEQPSDDYWMKLMINEGATFNSAITDGSTQSKRTLVFVEFVVYWPDTKSRRLLQKTIEPKLDNLFLNYRYRATDGSEVYAQQDAPKVINYLNRSVNKDKMNEKSIMYSFVVSHI